MCEHDQGYIQALLIRIFTNNRHELSVPGTAIRVVLTEMFVELDRS